MKGTTTIAWLLACVVAGGIGYLAGLGQAEQAKARMRELEAEAAALRNRSERLETPERFDIESNERQAIASLRAILTAANVHQTMDATGDYPKSLEALGPQGDGILDEALASGHRHGYVVTYTPQVQQGHIVAFVVVARPEVYEKTGRRSFFADQSGLIRFTLENRAPSARDATL